MKKSFLVFPFLWISCYAPTEETTNSSEGDLKLWHGQPAEDWMQEALPIGNAYLAAMTFGGVPQERIQFNEESLWAGGKGEWAEYNGGNRENAHRHLPEIRRLLREGKFDEAHALANKELTGIIKANKGNSVWEGYGAYQSFGDLLVEVGHRGEVKNYRRELNISKALSTVSYTSGAVKHQRTYFASYPKRVLVFRFENDATNGTDYVIRQTSLHKQISFSREGDQLVMRGALENNGMGFESRVLVQTDGEEWTIEDNEIHVRAANEVTLYLTAATDYLNEYPHYKGRDFVKLNSQTLGALFGVKYQEILAEHLADYTALFDRVSLKLPSGENNALPTNERLKKYGEGAVDPDLEALYFQYGRYLLISSSRPGSMPANLQGKWNHSNNPPWAADYHANINIQMIYWPAEVTNLAECHEPLIEFVDRLRVPGRKSAKDFFNADGWIVNTMNNTFGFTAPGWEFPWGFFPAGAAWYGQHVWEHYAFQPDLQYLRKKAFPIMKEAARFWLDYLTEDEDGLLVSSPSYSPEHGGISQGAFMDIQIVQDLFSNCIAACEILGIDDEFKCRVVAAKEKLLPLKIGRWGQLQEWKEDVDDPENKHRHVSHLFALHPGNQITPERTPELAEAAKVSLEARGDDGTGWSLAWKINFWARLKDGDRAHKLLRRALRITGQEGFDYMDGGGVYENLLSTHPPFQLDGNMGATAGIAEMLLQSHGDVIELLPALPQAWPDGAIRGLRARGGYAVDINWRSGELVEAVIKSISENSVVKIRYKDLIATIETGRQRTVTVNTKLEKQGD